MLPLKQWTIHFAAVVSFGLWVMSGANAADPYALTVVPVGPNNPRNSEAANVELKSGA